MRLLASLLTLLALAGPARAAGTPEEPRRAEARVRFDRGIALLEEHSDAEALAEFQRAYDLVADRQTLLMIGVVEANLKRPVEAVRAFDRVLADPGPLNARQLAVARDRRAEELRKIAFLRITTSVPATVEVDGIDAGRTPSTEPLAVAAGTRIVGAVSPGYLPTHKEVTVAGGVTAEVVLELVPSELRAAHLTVRSALPDADVVIDGERVARTPLSASLTVAPGERLVELRRPGYAPASGRITVGDGASAEIALQPVERPDADTPRAPLVLEANEPELELTVDGGPRGVYRQPITLPAGRHLVRIERAGFVPVERMVELPSAAVRVRLAPTPETRARYVERARTLRRGGWIAVVAGGVVAAGAGLFLAASGPALGRARNDRDTLRAIFQIGGVCYDMNPIRDPRDCERDAQAAEDRVSTLTTRVNLEAVALGVGVAALATGAVLLLTGDDPARYDDALPLALAPAPHGGLLVLGGRF